jgi:hypothetical protein
LQKHLGGHNCQAICTAEQQPAVGPVLLEGLEELFMGGAAAAAADDVKLLHKFIILELLM